MNRPLIHTSHLCYRGFMIRDTGPGPYTVRMIRWPHCGKHWQETWVEVSERKKLTVRSWVVMGPEV